jgi:hypothetical protein
MILVILAAIVTAKIKVKLNEINEIKEEVDEVEMSNRNNNGIDHFTAIDVDDKIDKSDYTYSDNSHDPPPLALPSARI